jgi:hypothetical protein
MGIPDTEPADEVIYLAHAIAEARPGRRNFTALEQAMPPLSHEDASWPAASRATT